MRLALVAVAGAAGVAATAVLSSGGGGPSPGPPGRAAVRVTGAASGPAGVVVVRDGTLLRVDQQSPPGRLIVPPPPGGARPDAVAVGAARVWVATRGVVRGYAPGLPGVRVFRVAAPGPLRMAEGARVLWSARPGATGLGWARLDRRPPARGLAGLPGPLTALGAGPRGALALVGGRGATLLVAVARPPVSRGRRRVPPSRVLAALPGRGVGLAVGRRFAWALTDAGLFRWDARRRRLAGPFAVPRGATELATGGGRVAVAARRSGRVLEGTPGGRRLVHALGGEARGLAADGGGFWVTVGPDAIPRHVDWGTRAR